MRELWIRLVSVWMGLALLAANGSAQCIRPDNLDGGPCCTTAQPKYPTPEPFNQNSLSICWKDCDVDSIDSCRAEWGATYSTLGNCKRVRQRLKLIDAAGVTKWRGTLNVQYSRTWLETDAAGNDMQVWRYLVNGNLKPTATAGGSCGVPPCAGQFNNRVRFTGYQDLVKVCGASVKQHAWMLTHACDLIDHAPGFPRAGFFHPDRSYTFVGPAAGFAVGPVQPVAVGGSPSEAVRRVNLPGAGVVGSCEYEEQIDFALSPQQQFCLCGPAAATPQWVVSDLNLASICGTAINTPGGPFLPGYLSMGIGSWTDPTRYPGVEALRYNTGGYDYLDPCTGVNRRDVFFGVTTMNGNQAISINFNGPGFPLPLTFIDQSSSIRSGATIMNTPFNSDLFLNLNL